MKNTTFLIMLIAVITAPTASLANETEAFYASRTTSHRTMAYRVHNVDEGDGFDEDIIEFFESDNGCIVLINSIVTETAGDLDLSTYIGGDIVVTCEK